MGRHKQKKMLMNHQEPGLFRAQTVSKQKETNTGVRERLSNHMTSWSETTVLQKGFLNKNMEQQLIPVSSVTNIRLEFVFIHGVHHRLKIWSQ